MKKYIALIGTAVLGSAITLFSVFFFQSEILNVSDKTIQQSQASLAKQVVYNPSVGSTNLSTDFTAASAKITPAVVNISTKATVQNSAYPPGFEMWQEFFGPQLGHQNPDVQLGTGSGVIVSSDGYIVTNNHVIEGADEIEITLNDNRSYTGTVIGTDPNTDIALVKVEADSLPTVLFANSDDVQVGEWVLACGNPFSLNSTVTAGIVSAKGRNINILRQRYAIESFIQTDAAINPGNSGGALVNEQGDLIGINTAIASPTGAYSGYGFAVPANIVSKVIYDLKTYGVVQRGFIGVSIRDVDSHLAETKKLSVVSGVYVDAIVEDGAADKAGMEAGDVILEVDGMKVQTTSELQEIIGRRTPGDAISIKIDRDGKQQMIKTTLTNKDGNMKITDKNNVDILANLGLELEKVSPKSLAKIGLDKGIQVTSILDGIIRKSTSMKKGFIITAVDGTAISSIEQFSEIMKKKSGGVMIEGVYPNNVGTYYYAFGM